MKAITYSKYGSPDVLQFKEIEKPIPKDNEVLVQVHATSLNAADLDQLTGISLVRIGGLFKPRYKILGSDLAGRITAIGRNVKKFHLGDEVFGDLSVSGFGTFAEYVCVPAKVLSLKPANMSFEDAAALSSAAIIALQGIRDKGPILPGQKVLINGAGGSIGTFAVQIAKSFGAELTAVDCSSKLEMLRSIGADHVIDYAQEDYTKRGQTYDLILDLVANRSIFAYKRILNSKGIYVMGGGTTKAIFQSLILGSLISMRRDKKMGILMWKPNKKEDVQFIKNLYSSRKIVPIIDRRYPLSEVANALRYLETGNARGKIIISMDNNTKI